MSVQMTYRHHQKQLINQLRAATPDQLAGRASLVPLRADYETDPALALTSVIFIPPDLANHLARTLIDPLRAIDPGHHYYPPDTMHLTIKNIRKIHHPPRFTPADIAAVDRCFRQIIPRHAIFPLSLEELVPLPTSLALIAYSDERLQHLVHALDLGLVEIGLPDDKHYLSNTIFFGNITLCRYTHPPSPRFLEAAQALTHTCQAELSVQEIHLITCNAVCHSASRQLHHSYRLSS